LLATTLFVDSRALKGGVGGERREQADEKVELFVFAGFEEQLK
jgi:hypothetical protein